MVILVQIHLAARRTKIEHKQFYTAIPLLSKISVPMPHTEWRQRQDLGHKEKRKFNLSIDEEGTDPHLQNYCPAEQGGLRVFEDAIRKRESGIKGTENEDSCMLTSGQAISHWLESQGCLAWCMISLYPSSYVSEKLCSLGNCYDSRVGFSQPGAPCRWIWDSSRWNLSSQYWPSSSYLLEKQKTDVLRDELAYTAPSILWVKLRKWG